MEQKELFEMFKIGIDKERASQDFYKGLIEKIDNPTQKEIFRVFLKEEEKHEEKLMEMYNDLKKLLGL